jgi:hypothetical protein
MEEKLYDILKKHKLPLKKREALMVDLLGIFSIMSRSYGIVRWHDNEHEDVVCINREKAQEYVEKYNKLAGKDECYVDDDIWLPLSITLN